MQGKTSDEARHEIEDMLRGRMWIHPEQVRVVVRGGVVTLTGAVDRRSTAGIVARLTADVPGVSHVVDQVRFDFDDTDLLVRSRVSRTHPFSADSLPPAGIRRRSRKRGRRLPCQEASMR
ncbi:BON domain-containing protein [Actinoplanes regularis]|uniref:BON domain-containing protein n=1 Tax=Actinoplanes regularis TaxID=52697 RepID=A0A239JGA0_9ACTN|nr:BON domain-containing protein [Actinoplanes regularis]GIE92014.1 hypothetical protein Are01nite_84940 [Actinoplanes regularis]SNT05056.1 BON domain-containing protein [Actinoplanes regularis]